MSAHSDADQCQNDPSHGKLCSAEHHRGYFFRIDINQDRGDSISDLRDQDKSFTGKRESHIQGLSHQVDHNHTSKSKHATRHFSPGHPFVSNDQAGHQYRNKVAKSGDNASFYSGSVGNTDVKKEILSHRLCQTHRNRVFQDRPIRNQHFFLPDGCKNQNQQPCQRKPNPGKFNLTRRIRRIHLHQPIPRFNHRNRASP